MNLEVIELSSSPPRPQSKVSSSVPHNDNELIRFCDRNDIDPDTLDDEQIDILLEKSQPVRSQQSRRTLPDRSSPLISQNRTVVNPKSNLRTSSVFDDSIFDNFNDFESQQPAKKRKFSPLRRPNGSPITTAIDVFDLSSDPAVIPLVDQVPIYDLEHDDSVPSFSSSAPGPSIGVKRNVVKEADVVALSDDDDLALLDPIISSSQPVTASVPVWTARTNAVLENIKFRKKAQGPSVLKATNVTSYNKATKASRPIRDVVDNILDSSPPKPTKAVASISKQKGIEKSREKLQKAAAREADKEEKKKEKERKAAEKQLAKDVAEVNKRKTDKKVSVEEMVVDLPMVFKGKALGNRVEEKIKELGAEHTYYINEHDLTNDCGRNFGNIIRWRRKVQSTYDEKTEEWVPTARSKLVQEKHILVHITAEDFCLTAALDTNVPTGSLPTPDMMKDNLDTSMTLLRSKYPQCTIILLVDGMAVWLKKSVNARNRDYAAVVRAQVEPEASQTSKTKKKRKPEPPVDLSFFTHDLVEELMLHLQLLHQPLQIHHAITTECWKQIVDFTQHLSTRIYRTVELDRNLAHASFCMASGQLRTGQGDAAETWIKMLEQINRLTAPMAKGIFDAGHQSPAQLVAAFNKVERSVTQGGQSLAGNTSTEREARDRAKLMLENVTRAGSNKRLGPAVSKRLYRVFTSRDENMRDGIA